MNKSFDNNGKASKSGGATIGRFQECLSILSDELELAIQWNRPSILLAVTKSGLSQIKARLALERKLNKLQQEVVYIQSTNKIFNIASHVIKIPNRENIVFFVSNISQGGGKGDANTYKALNLYRETFIENKIRMVLWLTEIEAVQLPRLAPDFWSFRHRVIEFSSGKGPFRSHLPAGIFIWRNTISITDQKNVGDQITLYENLYGNLPAEDESLETRLGLLHTLSHLYWLTNDLVKASKALGTGYELAEQTVLSQARSDFLNGLAIINYERGNYEKAISSLQKVVRMEPKESGLLMNLAICLQAVGKNREALLTGRKAITIDGENSRLWSILGCLYLVLQKFDDAIISFQKALMLDPGNINYHYSLAVCYQKAGYSDKTHQHIKYIGDRFSEVDDFHKACEKAILGDIDGTIHLLKQAIKAKQLSISDIRRTPIIHFLLTEPQIESLA